MISIKMINGVGLDPEWLLSGKEKDIFNGKKDTVEQEPAGGQTASAGSLFSPVSKVKYFISETRRVILRAIWGLSGIYLTRTGRRSK